MNPVEDIIINKQAPQKNKGSKVILILIFLLAILLVGACGAYYWFTNIYETPKAAFFKYLGQTNIPEITDTSVYYNMLERMNTSNYETTTEANFTTTEKTEFTQNVDVSNFLVKVKTLSNKDTKEAYLGTNITYRDNPFFDFEIVTTRDNVAIGSKEVLDRYIATSKYSLADSLKRTMGTEKEVTSDTVSNEMKAFTDNRINLDEEYKKQKATEYLSKIMEKVPDEAVTLTENSPITINSDVVKTKAYALKLEANEYSAVLQETLNTLKDDTDFLEKLVTGNPSEPEPEPVEEVKTPKPITIQRVEGETVEHEMEQEIEAEVPDSSDEAPIPVNLDENEEEIIEEEDSPKIDILMPPDMNLLDMGESPIFNMSNFGEMSFEGETEEDDGWVSSPVWQAEEEPAIEEPENIFIQLIEALVFNQKLDMSVEELQNKLDEEIQNVDSSDGLEITVYVRDVDDQPKETIKVLAKFSQTATLDIEYPESSKAKVTFLNDVVSINEEGEEVAKNQGSSIEIKRKNTDLETSFKIVLNTIAEQKVVERLQIDLTTKGTGNSKTYENEVIIKNSDSEGDTKVNIKNTIDFKKTVFDKEITEENAIFVDQISDEEAGNLFANIMIKLMELYSDKFLNMNFIDVTGNEEDSDREVYSFGKTTADSLLPGQVFDDIDDLENPEESESSETTSDEPEIPIVTVTVTEEPREEEPETPTENSNNQSDESNSSNTTTQPNTVEEASSTNTVFENNAVNVETISKKSVKNLLIAQIDAMVKDAHNNNREFTIKDLSNLPTQIEGMNVSSTITEDKATIKIAGYAFYVDKDLTLTEE